MATTSKTQAERLMTADEFMRLPDRYVELIDGKVVHLMPPLLDHADISGRVFFALETFNRRHKLGRVFTEGSFRVQRHPEKVRAPDVCFIENSALENKNLDSYLDGAPTLAIEIVSKNDSLRKTKEKADEFLEAGAQAAWIIHPKQRCVFVRTPDEPEAKYTLGQSVPGGDILPGFELPVAQLFED
ncbi:MAG: Uma2 family endonuclease [Armatimonadetes bacterium]|nr:Uma2 family endonuclease [Armatimonadota bacterium]